MNVRELRSGSYVSDDDPGEPGTDEKRISITSAEGKLLAFLVANKRVLEIGTGLGVSTDFIATHARKVVTVDIDPWVWANVWPELQQNHRGKINCLGHRDHVLGMFDVAFIDGRHTTEETNADIGFCRQHITRGLILVHDARIPEVAIALHLHQDIDFFDIPTTHGIGFGLVGFYDQAN